MTDERDSVEVEFERITGRSPRRIGKLAAAVVAVATLLGYGVGIGRLMQRVDSIEGDVTKLQAGREEDVNERHKLDLACRERAIKLMEATRSSMGGRDSAIEELQRSVLALSTEVRVRHGVPEYSNAVVSPTKGWVSQREREKLAAKQSDRALRKAIMAAPRNADEEDALEDLSF